MARQGLAAVREGWSRPSGKILVIVNLGLLAGVLYFDWSVFDIVFLYWAENLVIGLINVLKMITADPDGGLAAWSSKLFIIPFFVVHYGAFCFGHGVFIFALFNEAGEFGDDLWTAVPLLLTGGLALSLAVLALSHGASFLLNYLGGGEFRRTTPTALMMRPYGRIVALHITIIIGGFLAMALGDHIALLAVLVVLKTFVDLAMHGRERQKYLGPASGPIMSDSNADRGPKPTRRTP